MNECNIADGVFFIDYEAPRQHMHSDVEEEEARAKRC